MVTEVQMEKNLLSRLNDAQVEAVCQRWGPSLVVAGAGSGKTTVLTRRIAYLMTELKQDPYSILAVTFTNKAAQEMKGRVETIVGKETGRHLTIGTFHSICARILRREIENYTTKEGWRWTSNFVIYDETDSNNIMKGQIKKLDLDEKVFNPKEMKNAVSALKNDGYSYELYASEATTYRETRLAQIFKAYQAELAHNNALDFDDLLLIFCDLLKKSPEVRQRLRDRFAHVLVDEFQDTNKVQYEMIRLLTFREDAESAWEERSLLVVGDVDQSIYSWRKADYRIFLGFQGDYKGARLIKLEDNYRSTSTILDIANSIIENNTERIEKVLRCNKGRGGKAQYYEGVDEIDEAFYVVEELKRLKARGRNLNDCVILYRTNAQSRSIEEVLIRNDIPYKVVGGTRFYDRQEIKDMVAYLKLVFNPRDGIAFNRVVNTPKRGLGKTTLDRVADYAGSRGISTIEAARDAQFIGNLSARAVSALKEFAYQVLERWQSQAHKKERNAVSGLIELILSDTKYMEMLEEQAISNKDELAYGRIENVREFLAVAKEFEEIADEPDLDSFLTRISLVSDLDQVELEDEAIKLMTLHSAKGLEFPVVFMIGLEDGLFPHSRSFDEPTAMEEERRLMYVGVTRAEDLLYVTRARKRTMLSRGGPNASGFQTSATIASRFLSEITPGLLTGYYPQEKQERESSRQFEDFGWSSGGPESYEDSDQGSYGGGSGSRGRSSGNYGRGSGNYGNSYGNTYSQGSNSRTGSSSRTGSGSGSSSSSRPGSGSSRPSSPSRSSSPSRPSSPARPGTPRPRLAMRPGDVSSSQISSGSKSESQEAEPAFERLSVGDTVQHAKFGTGKVEAVLGEGSKELYNIDFGESGKRLMDPRFAKLIKLP